MPGGDDIIPVINRLQDKFDLVIATRPIDPYEFEKLKRDLTGKGCKIINSKEITG